MEPSRFAAAIPSSELMNPIFYSLRPVDRKRYNAISIADHTDEKPEVEIFQCSNAWKMGGG